MSRSKRSSMEIVAGILQAAGGDGATMTSLACSSSCNFKRATAYVEKLVAGGLLEDLSTTPTRYRTTNRGALAIRVAEAGVRYMHEGSLRGRPEEPFADPAPLVRIRRDCPPGEEVTVSFGNLSSVCELRSGDQCAMGGCACTRTACFIVRATEDPPELPAGAQGLRHFGPAYAPAP